MAETVLAATEERGPAAPREKRMPHIQALDGVRGLAIILVLLVHLLWSSNRSTGHLLLDLLLKIKNTGWVGVDLFFALSGFLITGILFDSLTSKHYFRNFYMRRALRIFPLYYGVLLILFILFRPTWNTGRQLYLLPFYLQNTSWWWHGSQVGAIKDVTGHLWSLAVEEQFYLVWPVIVFLIRDRRKLLWVALALALTAPITRMILLAHGAKFEATYKLTLCRSDALLAGGWLALAIRGKYKETILRAAAPVFCVALIGCFAIAWRTGSFNWEDSRLINGFGYSILALASTSLIAMALVPRSPTASIMNLPVLRWLGKYSYGIYIFHQMMGGVYASFLQGHIHSRAALHATIVICNLVLTLPLAWLSFRFYEQPFLGLKRYFGPA
jgi:peptidoglycan/LPS O-acetylase OafA/YrhL